jgi:hypothetical protein
MIEMWRAYFKNPTAFFGFVELEPWKGVGTNLADFRVGQLSSLALAHVGVAIATDIGDPTGPFTSIHPRNKKVVGKRLAAAALTMAYGTPTVYLPPSYKSAAATVVGTKVTVTVAFDQVPTTLVIADDHCKTEPPYSVAANECAWFTISVAAGGDGFGKGEALLDLNATATVGADGKSVVLTAIAAAAGATVATTAFGWNAWPINTIQSAEGLPLQPWTAKAVHVVEVSEL